MRSVHLSLRQGGWVEISVRASTSHMFEKMLDNLKKLPVIKFEKKIKAHVTSIYHLDRLYDICAQNGWDVYVTDVLDEYHFRFKSKLKRILKARENTEFSSPLWSDDPDKKVRSYQAQAINVVIEAKKYMEGDDMGLGKTIVGIGVICKAFDLDYTRALVVVNNRLKYQWKEQILSFTKIKEEDVSVIDSSKNVFQCPLNLTDKADFRSSPCRGCHKASQCKEDRDDPDLNWRKQLSKGRIVICNYESLDKMKDAIIKAGFDIFIYDEATRMKNAGSSMAKAGIKITNSSPFHSIVLPMSGTFIENRLEEIFPPFAIMDKRILGEYYAFKNRYLVFDFWGKCIGTKNEKKLKKIIDSHVIRREVDEVWKDRPPLIEILRSCPMEEQQRKIYENAKEGVLKGLADKKMSNKINMAEIGALLNYLMQICDTPETIDPKTKVSGKINALKDLILEEINPKYKVIIFNFFGNKVIPILEREIKALKVGGVVVITGKTKQTKGEELKQKFMKDPNCRFLICSDAMSYGANLQCARYVVNFGIRWNPAVMDQRVRRAYRIGQQFSVTAVTIVAENSIEDRMVEVVGDKRSLFNRFLGKGDLQKKKVSMSDLLSILRAC